MRYYFVGPYHIVVLPVPRATPAALGRARAKEHHEIGSYSATAFHAYALVSEIAYDARDRRLVVERSIENVDIINQYNDNTHRY